MLSLLLLVVLFPEENYMPCILTSCITKILLWNLCRFGCSICALLSPSFYTNCDDENIHVHPFGCILMLIDFVVWMWIHKTERVFCRLHGESYLKRYISMVVLVCGVLLFLVGIQKRERESEIILCFFCEIRRILPSYKNVHSFSLK